METHCRRCAAEVQPRFLEIPGSRPRPIPVPYCDPCAAVVKAEREAAAEVERQEAFKRKCQHALAELDVPPEFAWATTVDAIAADWGTRDQRQRTARAIDLARRIVAEMKEGLRPPPFVVFCGRPGNGKTLITWAIAHQLAGQLGRSTRVIRLSSMVDQITEHWGTRGSGAAGRAALRRFTTPDFLGIDEVSRDAFFGKPRQHLYNVISERIERGRPTVITTNENMDGVKAILGEALMSRLHLGGRLDFGWDEDRRQIPQHELREMRHQFEEGQRVA